MGKPVSALKIDIPTDTADKKKKSVKKIPAKKAKPEGN